MEEELGKLHYQKQDLLSRRSKIVDEFSAAIADRFDLHVGDKIRLPRGYSDRMFTYEVEAIRGSLSMDEDLAVVHIVRIDPKTGKRISPRTQSLIRLGKFEKVD